MSELKYKVGDKVLIKSLDWYNENKNEDGNVDCGEWNFTEWHTPYCGEVMTIRFIWEDYGYYKMFDSDNHWTDEMIEGLVEEETKPEFDYVAAMEDLMGLDIEKSCILNDFDEYKKAVEEHGFFSEEALSCKYFIHLRKIGTAQNILEKFGFNLPEGYIFKDENGNEILTNKIILEKKKKEVTHPKTYEECCEVLKKSSNIVPEIRMVSPEESLMFSKLIRLKRCRDAYWKIAGEQMGLDEPWEPDWNDGKLKWCMSYSGNYIEFDQYKSKHHTLAFPTEEMLDAFYENFKELIESCKELL